MNIMVATDSHLGFLERDVIRGQDSFLAFEEMLHIAQEKKVRACCAAPSCERLRYGYICAMIIEFSCFECAWRADKITHTGFERRDVDSLFDSHCGLLTLACSGGHGLSRWRFVSRQQAEPVHYVSVRAPSPRVYRPLLLGIGSFIKLA